MTKNKTNGVKNVVLVHGGFVGRLGLARRAAELRSVAYNVTVVQNPTASLADDVALTKRALAAQDGPAILVGHSYGGVVVTEAGNDPKVAALVYVAAFAPDAGESVASIIKESASGAPCLRSCLRRTAFLFLDKEQFAASFAADVAPDLAAFMDGFPEVPWGVEALAGAVSQPSWKSKLAFMWSRPGPHDPPACPTSMATRAGSRITEVAGSHALTCHNLPRSQRPSSSRRKPRQVEDAEQELFSQVSGACQ